MPTLNVYLPESDAARLIREAEGEGITGAELLQRLARWFLKAPDMPLRRSAITP